MFERLLGPKSFDNLKGALVCKQISILITFDGIEVILTIIIVLAYLGYWDIVASIIVVRFIVNQCPFFFS
jgi:hypothetical protein